MGKTQDLKERIVLVDGKRKPTDVKAMNLDSCKAENLASVIDLLEAHTNLEELSLIGLGLNSLTPFPALPKLRKIWLCDNKLAGGLDKLASCPGLEVIYLGGNVRIANVETFEPLKLLPSLRSLDLFGCNITNLENYRENLLRLLPKLSNLDSFDREGKEIPDSDSDDEDAGEDEYGDTSDEENLEEEEKNGVLEENSSSENSSSENEEEEEEEESAAKGLKRKNED